jgi:hypothetical protein
MAVVFISYRRADSDVIAGRMRDRLARSFGDDSIFMDIDNIPFGVDFREHVKTVLMRGQVMIAVIGKNWLARDEAGRSRLEDETDPVRIEIEAALARKIPIIPVLVGGATMPKPAELPANMQDFAFYNAADVDLTRDFHPHMDRLIRSMERLLKPAGQRTGRIAMAAAAALVLVCAGTALAIHWAGLSPWREAAGPRPETPPPAAPPSPTPEPPPATTPSATPATWRTLFGVETTELKAKIEDLRRDGFAPQTISGYRVDGATRYVSLWSKRSHPPNSVGWEQTAAGFQKRHDDLRKSEHRPIFVSAYESASGVVRYADMWERTPGPAWEMKWNLTAAELRAAIEELGKRGLRPVHVYGYALAGVSRFAAIFEERDGEAPLSLDTASGDRQKEWDNYGNNGYRPKTISGYALPDGDHLTTLWAPGAGWSARYGVQADRYDATVEEYTKRDMRMTFLSAYGATSGTRFNMVWAK